jgi:tetratricopeptide (TPR) repeat protein
MHEKAMYELALDIYHISVAHGPENIAVTGGYYQLGNVFHKTGRDSHATGFFDRAVAIWKAAFATGQANVPVLLTSSNDSLKSSDAKLPALPSKPLSLNSARVAEALQMLDAIYAFRAARPDSQIAANEAMYVLAQVYACAGQLDRARDHAARALEGIRF